MRTETKNALTDRQRTPDPKPLALDLKFGERVPISVLWIPFRGVPNY